MGVRLQKYLASCDVASRRESERIILEGRVAVNGTPAQLGQSIDPETDTVTLDDRPLSPGGKVYILFHKPRNTITSAKDTHRRRTVLDYLEGVRERVYPVGRLDMDVSGALLMTNDGELAYRLTHPKFEVEKTYQVRVAGHAKPDALGQLEQGVRLEDGVTAPARVQILRTGPGWTLLRLTLHEGRKREVKRMCAAVGLPARRLTREEFAGLRIDDLAEGAWRYLTREEIAHLCRLTGLSA